MDLRRYLTLVRKWAVMVIGLVILAAGTTYAVSRQIRPIYRADTTMLVGLTTQNQTANVDPTQSTTNFANAYALLATQPAILQATAEVTQWNEPWQNLYYKVIAKATGSQIIQISVTDFDPAQAQRLADQVAQQLILKGPIGTQQRQSEEQSKFVAGRLTRLRTQIDSIQKTLDNLNTQAALETDPVKLSELNARGIALQANITDMEKNYAALSQLILNNNNLLVTVLAPAQLPLTPISPNIPLNILFAALFGMVIGLSGAILLEYLDDTFKDADDLQRILNLTLLGTIMRISDVQQPKDSLITFKHPRSPISEAYRVLRTNLRFSSVENPTGTLVVTSAGPEEGKTTTAANLAVTIAQGGRRVILLDADLRRPTIHKLFGLSNEVGLSSLFVDESSTLDHLLRPTEIATLQVLTSGPLPPNPAEILDSGLMKKVLGQLREQSDLVILDSPPVLAVADASILSAYCSGTILVIDAGRTRSEAGRRALQTLKQTGAKIFGAVLNKLSSQRASGYYSYYYYSSADKHAKNATASSTGVVPLNPPE